MGSVGSCIRRVSNSSKVRSSAPSLYKFATSPVPGGGVLGCSKGPTELSAKLLSPMSVHHRPVEVVGVKVLGQSTSSAFYVKRHPQVLSSAFRLWSEEALRDIYRLQTFPALGHLVGYLLALFEGLKSAACYPRVVHEHVFATILWSDEAKALLVVEPLDRSLGHVPRTPRFFLRFLCKGQTACIKSVATAAPIYSRGVLLRKTGLIRNKKRPSGLLTPYCLASFQ